MRALVATFLFFLASPFAVATDASEASFETFKLAEALNRYRVYVRCMESLDEDCAGTVNRLRPHKYRTYWDGKPIRETCSVTPNPTEAGLAKKNSRQNFC
jgi:hypothetical protein